MCEYIFHGTSETAVPYNGFVEIIKQTALVNTRKKVVASEMSVTFHERGGTTERLTDFCVQKSEIVQSVPTTCRVRRFRRTALFWAFFYKNVLTYELRSTIIKLTNVS